MVSLLDCLSLLAELPACNCFPVSHATSVSSAHPQSSQQTPISLKVNILTDLRPGTLWSDPLPLFVLYPVYLSPSQCFLSFVIPRTRLSQDSLLCHSLILIFRCLHNSDPYVLWGSLKRSHLKGSFLHLHLLNNTLTVPLPLVSSLLFVLFSSVSSALWLNV